MTSKSQRPKAENSESVAIDTGEAHAALLQSCPVAALAVRPHITHNGRPFTFAGYDYLKSIFTDRADEIIIQKSSQVGASEWLIMYSIAEAMQARKVLYVLPTFELKNLFVKTRINPAITYNSAYKALAVESGERQETVSIKSFGKGMIIYLGTQSDVAFISHAADTLIIDELDRCDQENLSLAPSRLSASEHKKIIQVSNPTIDGFGITVEYGKTDRRRWHIKCARCGKWTVPDFFQNVVERKDEDCWVVRDRAYSSDNQIVRMICGCGRPLQGIGQWVADDFGFARHGYLISKMFSSRDTLLELVNRFSEGLANDSKLQAFYNMDLGLPYTPQGAKLTTAQLDACTADYSIPSGSDRLTIAGIDVGKTLHVMVAEPTDEGLRIIYIGEVLTREDVVVILNQYSVKAFVIDALPETRLSKSLSVSYAGGFMCYFGGGKISTAINPREKIITAQRTVAMDAVKEAVMLKKITLPKNASTISGFYPQMTAPTRVLNKTRNEYEWVEGGQPDHYFLTTTYLLLAKKILTMIRR